MKDQANNWDMAQKRVLEYGKGHQYNNSLH